jgi:hypothetical protein
MKCLLLSVSLFLCVYLTAQQKPTDLDKSPMDMSYWPANYPILKMSGKAKDLPVARVIYGRPLKNGRDIFGGIIKYNELWRMGANEASEIEFFKNVKIDSKTILKGRYTLYCIPTEKKWTLILNKDNFCWGNFSYDIKKDLLRTDIDISRNAENTEAFTIFFEETKNGAQMVILWDDLKAGLPITIIEDVVTKPKKN